MKWTQKPITWGGYFKLAGVAVLISAVFSAISLINLYGVDIKGILKEKFSRKKPEQD